MKLGLGLGLGRLRRWETLYCVMAHTLSCTKDLVCLLIMVETLTLLWSLLEIFGFNGKHKACVIIGMSLTLQYFSVKFGLAEENHNTKFAMCHLLTHSNSHMYTHTSHYTHMHSHTQGTGQVKGGGSTVSHLHPPSCVHAHPHTCTCTHTHTHTQTHPIWTVLNVVLKLWRRNNVTSIERTSLVILHTVILRRKKKERRVEFQLLS